MSCAVVVQCRVQLGLVLGVHLDCHPTCEFIKSWHFLENFWLFRLLTLLAIEVFLVSASNALGISHDLDAELNPGLEKITNCDGLLEVVDCCHALSQLGLPDSFLQFLMNDLVLIRVFLLALAEDLG